MAREHILKNLYILIRNTSLTYLNEFVWQDIELTNEFKEAYSDYLDNNRYDIEFLGATAVITSSSNKYIYVPNQWFVIAAYVVDIYDELQLYKEYFKNVCDRLNKRPDLYAKTLRDSATIYERNTFIGCAKEIFSEFCSDEEIIDESASRLWRFVNDYSWWSGQKTVDRSDFHLSVILNMLNLVNASQSYVGDIVSAYANDHKLRKLVQSIDGFTMNMDTSLDRDKDYTLPDKEIRGTIVVEAPAVENTYTIPKPEKVRIKINGTNTLKEIKYRG